MDAERALEDFLAALSAERNASRHTLDAYQSGQFRQIAGNTPKAQTPTHSYTKAELKAFNIEVDPASAHE